MFRQAPPWIVRLSGWLAILALAALWLLGTATFSWLPDWLRIGPNVRVPDARFGYNAGSLFAFFERLGEQQLRWLALSQLTLDVAYPAVYSCLLGALIVRAYGPRGGSLAWLPVFAGAADLVENVLLAFLAVWGDRSMSGLVAVSSFFTTLKWLLLGMSVACVMIGGFWWLWNRLGSRRSGFPSR